MPAGFSSFHGASKAQMMETRVAWQEQLFLLGLLTPLFQTGPCLRVARNTVEILVTLDNIVVDARVAVINMPRGKGSCLAQQQVLVFVAFKVKYMGH